MVLPFSRALLLSTSVAALYAGAGAADAYAVGGNAPEFVADFAGVLNSGTEYYRSGGSDTTFSSVFTHSGLVLPATMTDSDGVLKWAPHNLVLNSASPATQSITVVSGADYTVEITGSGSVALSGAGSGTVTAGSPVEITASTTSLTLTVTGSPTTMWAYRSDLGGMVNNPDTSSTYVATTGAAKFLPRRNHYIFNGSTYDNAGILIEPAAATNLITNSNNLTSFSATTGASPVLNYATSPDGTTNAIRLIDDNSTGTGVVGVEQNPTTVATSTTYTWSIFAKSDQLSELELNVFGFTTPANGSAFFNLSTQSVSSVTGGITLANAENLGNGWGRYSVTFTTDASDTSGRLRVFATAGGSRTVDLDGTSSILIYGHQFEVGSVPTSYIPTSGNTVTRAAETLTVAGANLPANTTGMSFNWQGKISYEHDGTVFGLWYWQTDSSNRLSETIYTNGARSGLLAFEGAKTASSGTEIVSSNTYLAPALLVNVNTSARITTAEAQYAEGGTVFGTDSTVAIPDLSAQTLYLGKAFPLGISSFGEGKPSTNIALFRMWGVDIGQSGIETAST